MKSDVINVAFTDAELRDLIHALDKQCLAIKDRRERFTAPEAYTCLTKYLDRMELLALRCRSAQTVLCRRWANTVMKETKANARLTVWGDYEKHIDPGS